MSKLSKITKIETLEDHVNILSTSLDVILSYILKYSENRVVSGEVGRLFYDTQDVFAEKYQIATTRIELLRFDPEMKAHLLLMWGYTPQTPQGRSVKFEAYSLARADEEGAFSRVRCVKSIGV
jgi:hypothetical protein